MGRAKTVKSEPSTRPHDAPRDFREPTVSRYLQPVKQTIGLETLSLFSYLSVELLI